MHFNIIENFLDIKFCESLIKDANTFSKNDHISVLNNRLLLPSSSLSFLNLLNKSPSWQKLHEKLNSQNFLDRLLVELNLEKKNFLLLIFSLITNQIHFKKIQVSKF